MSDANATGRRRTEPSARAAIADSTPSHWHGRTVLGLGVVSFLTDLHSEAILALLPQFMAGVLGLTREAIGFIEGLAEATVAVIQFLAGHISDRLGVRKPIVVAGYTLSTIVKALLPAASRPWHVLSIRVADRAGKGIRTPPRDAMLADAVVAAQWGKAYGLHRAMDTGGAIAGTALALLLFRYTGSYQQTFAWAALAGAGAVLVLAALVAEPAAAGGARRQSPPVLRGYPAGFWVFVASYAIFSAANVTYAFFLLRAQDLGVPPTWVPAVYLLHNVVYAAAGLPIGALSDRFSAWKSTVSIYLLHAAVCIGLSFASTAWASVVAVAIYGVVLAGLGAATRALAAELIPSPLRASGMAIYRGVGGIAALPGSWAIGLLWDRFGPVTAWTCAAALAGVGAAVLLTLPRSRVHSAA